MMSGNERFEGIYQEMLFDHQILLDGPFQLGYLWDIPCDGSMTPSGLIAPICPLGQWNPLGM